MSCSVAVDDSVVSRCHPLSSPVKICRTADDGDVGGCRPQTPVRNNKLRLSRLGMKILTGRLASALVGKSSKIQYSKETQSQKPDGRNSMHYKPKSIGALQIALGGLPDRMRIEMEAGIAVSAKTVGELRKATSWPENLVITTPQEHYPEGVVKVTKASIVTHYPPRR